MLDVTATREIPNTGVEARVHIKGSVRSPELELTSTPPLDESDILSLIVFNRPVNELGSGERASLAATAGGIATGFLAAPLGQSIGRALDLDLFEINTTTESGSSGLASPSVSRSASACSSGCASSSASGRRASSCSNTSSRTSSACEANAAPETSGTANRIGQRRIERAGIDLIFFFSY